MRRNHRAAGREMCIRDRLHRVQYGDPALGGQIQLTADAGFQLTHVDQVVGLGDAVDVYKRQGAALFSFCLGAFCGETGSIDD